MCGDKTTGAGALINMIILIMSHNLNVAKWLCLWTNNLWIFFSFMRFQNLTHSLTYAVAENDGQNHSYPHGDQGGALPGAMFGWLLELESPSGQAVSGQRARRCGVNRPRRHGVTRGCCAEERCRSCARFKEEVPGEKKGKETGERGSLQITVKWMMVQNSIPKVSKKVQMKCQKNHPNTVYPIIAVAPMCITVQDELGYILIFSIILTLEEVNKKYLIKTIISHLPFYNWAFANSPLYLG